jgi:hypothetical protein
MLPCYVLVTCYESENVLQPQRGISISQAMRQHIFRSAAKTLARAADLALPCPSMGELTGGSLSVDIGGAN